jgi:hypothetical protein
MGTDYTDEVARFSDELCADTLAKFISSEGIPCDVEILIGPGLAGYRVTVRRALWGKLTQALKLTEAANYADPTSAVVVAGRLVREEIPCVIIGRTRNRLGKFGIAGMSTIAVPDTFLTRAERVLNA